MQLTEINKTEWPAFFDSFSRKHQGWLATLEMFGSGFGAQVQERDLPFEGITDEWDETAGNTIMIMSGGETSRHITHTISNPTKVVLEQTAEGADAALEIKSADGVTALLKFRSPVLPETVDAMM